jgi:hypothetical protein
MLTCISTNVSHTYRRACIWSFADEALKAKTFMSAYSSTRYIIYIFRYTSKGCDSHDSSQMKQTVVTTFWNNETYTICSISIWYWTLFRLQHFVNQCKTYSYTVYTAILIKVVPQSKAEKSNTSVKASCWKSLINEWIY